jgi:hypothetical protein
MKTAIGPPGGAEEDRRPAVSSDLGKPMHGGFDSILKRTLEDKILGRVAGESQFSADHKLATQSVGARVADALNIAVNIADDRVELCHRDFKRFGHRCGQERGQSWWRVETAAEGVNARDLPPQKSADVAQATSPYALL